LGRGEASCSQNGPKPSSCQLPRPVASRSTRSRDRATLDSRLRTSEDDHAHNQSDGQPARCRESVVDVVVEHKQDKRAEIKPALIARREHTEAIGI
jgi:hypothetical protein